MRAARDARPRMNRGHEIRKIREGQGLSRAASTKRDKPKHVPALYQFEIQNRGSADVISSSRLLEPAAQAVRSSR